MSFMPLDIVRSAIETNLLGSTMLFILIIVTVLIILCMRANLPPYIAVFLISPAIIGLANAGLLPAYVAGGVYLVFGITLGAIFIKLFIS